MTDHTQNNQSSQRQPAYTRFTGSAPVQEFLVDGTFPIGVPIIFAAGEMLVKA